MATRCVQCGADSEQARILRDRIQSDKRKLHTIESHMRKHDKRNPSPPDMDCPVVRDNPIFHDNPYDAMDAYIHKDSTEIKASHGRRGTGNSHRDIRSLYRECQRRINAAESLLDKASAEVRVCTTPTWMVVLLY